MRARPTTVVLGAAMALACLALAAAATPAPCLTQLQVVGSHNSYHRLPSKPIIDLLNSPLAKAAIPASAFLPQAWQYEHPSLTDQLNAGIRSFELDVKPDPAGGLYSTPAMLKFAGVPARLDDPAWKQPGYKVFHVPDIDFETNCVLFTACLNEIRAWSVAHPGHLPITINVETSFGDSDLVRLVGPENVALLNAALAASDVEGPDSLVTQPAVSPQLLTALETEISSVFPAGAIITPDSVRAALGLTPGADIATAILKTPSSGCPWPDLESLRGKVAFAFIFTDKPSLDTYTALHPNQNGALGWLTWDGAPVPGAVFATAGNFGLSQRGGVLPPTIPKNASAIVSALAADIKSKVGQGYVVRGRADTDTVEARAGYFGRAQAVIDAGANIISTDYPTRTTALTGINYLVQVPGGLPARCVNGAIKGYAGLEVTCAVEGQDARPVALGPDPRSSGSGSETAFPLQGSMGEAAELLTTAATGPLPDPTLAVNGTGEEAAAAPTSGASGAVLGTLAAALVALTVVGPSCEGTGWTLLFYDDFTTRDTTKWTAQLYDGFQYGIPGWGNSEYEWYTNRTENWNVANGILNLTARVETDGGTWITANCKAACTERCLTSGNTAASCVTSCMGTRCTNAAARAITSARIRTYKTFSAGPSAAYPNIRVDARAAMPAGAGLWPAIWMLPEQGATDACSGCGSYGSWPASGEIDLQESVNGATTAVGTIHYGGSAHQMVSGSTPLTPNTFNLHALEWSVNNMTWFLNGVAFGSANSDQWYSDGAQRSATAPFDKPFHLLLNLAAGGGWPAGDYRGATGVDLAPEIVRDGLNAAGGAKALQVDYIKVCGK